MNVWVVQNSDDEVLGVYDNTKSIIRGFENGDYKLEIDEADNTAALIEKGEVLEYLKLTYTEVIK